MADITAYLPTVQADYKTLLDIAPQKTMLVEGDKNQAVHTFDDMSVAVVTLSGSFFAISIQWASLSATNAQTIHDLYHDDEKANGRARTFYLQHPLLSDVVLVCRFMGPLPGMYTAGRPNSEAINAVDLRVEGVAPAWWYYMLYMDVDTGTYDCITELNYVADYDGVSSGIDSSGNLITAAADEHLVVDGEVLTHPQITNEVPDPDDITSANWVLGRTAVSATTTTAPDGSTIHKLVDSTDDHTHRLYMATNLAVTAGETITIGVIVKAAELSVFALILLSNIESSIGFPYGDFDVATGQKYSATGQTRLTAIGNTGFYFCSVTASVTATADSRVFLYLSSAWQHRSYEGTGTDGLFPWRFFFYRGTVDHYPITLPYGTYLSRSGLPYFAMADGDTVYEALYGGDYPGLPRAYDTLNGVADGVELVTNGDFSAWTGGAPDDYIILNSDANNFIIEHQNGARIVSDNTSGVGLQRFFSGSPNDTFEFSIEKSDHISGKIRWSAWDDSNGAYIVPVTSVVGTDANGVYSYRFTLPAGCTSFIISHYRDSTVSVTDYVISSWALQKVTTTATITIPFSAKVASADVPNSTSICIATPSDSYYMLSLEKDAGGTCTLQASDGTNTASIPLDWTTSQYTSIIRCDGTNLQLSAAGINSALADSIGYFPFATDKAFRQAPDSNYVVGLGGITVKNTCVFEEPT